MLDVFKMITKMKLMIIKTIRISAEMEQEIAAVAKAVGESKQTVIRLAIKEGLRSVLAKFGRQSDSINIKEK